MLRASRDHLDPRRLPQDLSLTVSRRSYTADVASVDIQMDPDHRLLLIPGREGWSAVMEEVSVTRDTVFVAGEIGAGRSLYETVLAGASGTAERTERIQMVYMLAEVYGWQLDFMHDIWPGDTFRALIQREVRPDGSVKAHHLLAGEVVSRGRSYPAVPYTDPEGRQDFYDLEGNSLRLMFKRYPVDYPRITSTFSTRRYHPILKVRRPHHGTDFGARRGTPVRVTADGTVIRAGRNGSYGNLVEVRHTRGYETRYAHLDGFARGVRIGTEVVQGQIVGYVGSTGLASAPHLHYEIRKGGEALDPRRVSLPGAPPVREQYLPAYLEHAARRMALLDAREMGRQRFPSRVGSAF
ncbi:MAG: M23 family metallopeptidase [bacterium]